MPLTVIVMDACFQAEALVACFEHVDEDDDDDDDIDRRIRSTVIPWRIR